MLLCHISVNVLNDYYDYKSGIDLKTRRTPFSGGSGILPAAPLKPRQVFWLGMVCFLLAVPIGVYFVIVSGLAAIAAADGGALLHPALYPAPDQAGLAGVGAGSGTGRLPVLGAYFVQTGEYTLPAIIASIPSAILVHNLLFLNEFPDAEADKTAGRKTLPITMGKAKASIIYSVLTGSGLPLDNRLGGWQVMPVFCLIALLTLPFAIKAIQGALKYQDMKQAGAGVWQTTSWLSC